MRGHRVCVRPRAHSAFSLERGRARRVPAIRIQPVGRRLARTPSAARDGQCCHVTGPYLHVVFVVVATAFFVAIYAVVELLRGEGGSCPCSRGYPVCPLQVLM
nr:uncharacterized protein LOC113805176 [Penaeus vannamei]